MNYETVVNKISSKKFILGNAANTSARVESMTKNFVDVDLLITRNTRQQCQQQAVPKFKKLFKKDESLMTPIGELRHIVKDHKVNDHNLYTISEEFNSYYKELSETTK